MASSMPERDANHVLIFVWLSNNVARVVVPVVFLILFILAIVGVPRRRGPTGLRPLPTEADRRQKRLVLIP
jgi:hypothetical protein